MDNNTIFELSGCRWVRIFGPKSQILARSMSKKSTPRDRNVRICNTNNFFLLIFLQNLERIMRNIMLSMITSYVNVKFINIKNIRNNNIYLYCIRILEMLKFVTIIIFFINIFTNFRTNYKEYYVKYDYVLYQCIIY